MCLKKKLQSKVTKLILNTGDLVQTNKYLAKLKIL